MVEGLGGAEAQWFGAILPRIQRFLPAARILELGPGFGRWTHYLLGYCDQLIGVDLSPRCVRACTERFGPDKRASFFVNDGQSLSMVPDRSIDFFFTFDTLVHAEGDVVGGYLGQLAAKLTPQGVGFVHHSNLGAYQEGFARVGSTPEPLRSVLFRRDFLGPTHWRAGTMTAALFEKLCVENRLRCITQELINWGTESLLIDCLSTFTTADGPFGREANVIVENAQFMKEAELIRERAKVYSARK